MIKKINIIEADENQPNLFELEDDELQQDEYRINSIKKLLVDKRKYLYDVISEGIKNGFHEAWDNESIDLSYKDFDFKEIGKYRDKSTCMTRSCSIVAPYFDKSDIKDAGYIPIVSIDEINEKLGDDFWSWDFNPKYWDGEHGMKGKYVHIETVSYDTEVSSIGYEVDINDTEVDEVQMNAFIDEKLKNIEYETLAEDDDYDFVENYKDYDLENFIDREIAEPIIEIVGDYKNSYKASQFLKLKEKYCLELDDLDIMINSYDIITYNFEDYYDNLLEIEYISKGGLQLIDKRELFNPDISNEDWNKIKEDLEKLDDVEDIEEYITKKGLKLKGEN